MDGENAKNDETFKMEETLIKMEYELQAHYCQMGKSLLELADSEQKTINSLVDEIINIRRRLAVARHEIQCPICMAYNTSDSKYCKRCGEALPEADSTEEDKNGT